jgi:hypothetical protein
VASGRWVSRAGVNLEMDGPLGVPYRIFLGERDALVPRHTLLQHAETSGAQVYELRGTGHVDLIYGRRAAQMVAPQMIASLSLPMRMPGAEGSSATRRLPDVTIEARPVCSLRRQLGILRRLAHGDE